MKYLDEVHHMVGLSKATRNLQNAVQKVAPLEAAVLLYGESGTGKELAARMIHDLSNRRESPFISVNCGALPRELLNTELFGHEKGSFTGAIYQHQGYFEQADSGTLLLDEITEMPLTFQVYLLRALETGTFRRVGGHQEIKTNPRVIATTNIDPWQAVETGKLRSDIFFRLAEFPLYLTPLRDRDEDVILLAQYFLDGFNETYKKNKQFTKDTLQFISTNSWPGNVRELRHAIHHAFILANDEIDEKEFHTGQRQSKPSYQDKPVHSLVGLSIEDIEKNLIPATLDHFKGDKKQTAQCLGISLKTLYNRLNFINGIDEKEDLNKIVNFSTKNPNAFSSRESD